MFGLLNLRRRLDSNPAGDLRFRRAVTPAASNHHSGSNHRNRDAGLQTLFDFINNAFFLHLFSSCGCRLLLHSVIFHFLIAI